MTEKPIDLSPIEKRVIYRLSGDLGESARPYADLGRAVDLSESEVIEVIKSLKEKGALRRFGATLRHQRSGFKANAMVAWEVDPDRVLEVGHKLADFPEVTHCYQRRTAPDWPHNLYTMIHGATEEECEAMARKMSRAVGVSQYKILFSQEELKKTSMRYFKND